MKNIFILILGLTTLYHSLLIGNLQKRVAELENGKQKVWAEAMYRAYNALP